MNKPKKGTGKTLPRIAALGLAGAVLWGGSMPQVSAATLKDVFDEHYYADTYKDLKELYGYDREALWNHYVQHGLSEGRYTNGLINVLKYRELYEDLQAAFGDDWDAYINHYLTVGAKEGRETGTDTEFNAFDYAARYADLQAAYGNDVLALWKHYQTAGAEEGREARSEEVLEAEREAEEEAEREAEEEKPETDTPQKPDASGGRTERVDLGYGNYAIEEYNEADELTKTTYYDKNNNISYYAIPVYENGKLTESKTYYPDGRYGINEFDENEKVIKFTCYLKDGKISYIHDGRTGIWSRYTYDSDGILTSIRDDKGTGPNAQTLKETFYDKDGSISYIRDYTLIS